jgi:transformation/transcription domain-associated protein
MDSNIPLANTKSLTMPLLQGLARLLELLSNWFSVTLGAKLVDHLGKKWLNPEKVADS